MKTNYLFTSESVSEGHPDKVADQISDAILDDFMRQDPASHVACETFVSTGLVVLGGEVSSSDAYVDIQKVARDVIRRIGYTKSEYKFDSESCAVISAIHEQSADIAQGVNKAEALDQGAGDQGIMFGYASNETADYMPLPLTLAHKALMILADIRRENPSPMPYLRPDAKSQFTIEYSPEGKALRVHTFVLSTQHDEFDEEKAMQRRIREDVQKILIPRLKECMGSEVAALFDDKLILHVNPTGKFVIGGPHGDTGLTGRKIIVDTYGGRGAHGGGAFSGKDASKVDRSAAYAARYIAKNMVAAGVADEIMVQLSYAIGIAEPVSIFVNTFGKSHSHLDDSELAERIGAMFDLRPAAIIEKFGLRNPIFLPTAAYGHFGRAPYKEQVELVRGGKKTTEEIQFFGWELLDSVDLCKSLL
ncbi:MAG: methionine adenosyltransferase [Bacteroidales bacterium]|nr:methionine adenosyltransferase [Bacteroidales bacterium]